jgi:hypothetical protein
MLSVVPFYIFRKISLPLGPITKNGVAAATELIFSKPFSSWQSAFRLGRFLLLELGL